jgi:hypothetical protein
MNTLAIIQRKIQKTRALADAQLKVTTYRGTPYVPCTKGEEIHGEFTYRGRTYTK